jgi:hypothetical protein
MDLSRYIIPLIPISYGILTMKGIHVPKIHGSGEGWIIVGIFTLILTVFLEYYDIKTGYAEEGKEMTLIDAICMLFFWLGVLYIALFLFEIWYSYYLMYTALLLILFCSPSRFKIWK